MFKKIIKISIIVLLVLIGVAFAAPFIFKGKIIELVKKQMNESLTAKVDFTDIDLSFFRHFPKVAASLSNLQVTGTDQFAADTLFSAKNIDVALNLMSVIKGSDFKIYSINVDAPRIHAIVQKTVLPTGILQNQTQLPLIPNQPVNLSVSTWILIPSPMVILNTMTPAVI